MEQFEDEGYVLVEGLLDPVRDLQPIVLEYSDLLDKYAVEWFEDGMPKGFGKLSFSERLMEVARATEGEYSQPLDISLPLKDIRADSPMHYGPAAFGLLRNNKVLDAVEEFLGPEIYSVPVQHVRIKPPEHVLPQDKRDSGLVGRTFWHQDAGVVTEEADDSNMLTVWIPITDATKENGGLTVEPGSKHTGLHRHCFTSKSPPGLHKNHMASQQVPVPAKAGDVIFMHKLTKHASLTNKSVDEVRWSFDLRYSPTKQNTGRECFPGFVARSRSNPQNELNDPQAWAEMWQEARSKISKGETPNFMRWDPNDPMCA